MQIAAVRKFLFLASECTFKHNERRHTLTVAFQKIRIFFVPSAPAVLLRLTKDSVKTWPTAVVRVPARATCRCQYSASSLLFSS